MALTDTAGGTQTDPGTGKPSENPPAAPNKPTPPKEETPPGAPEKYAFTALKVRNSIPARWRSSNQWRVN